MKNIQINKRMFAFSLAISILLFAIPALGASLSRDMLARVDPGSSFTVKLSIPDAKAGESLTVEETLPSGVTLTSWDLSGVKESKADLQKDPKKYRVKGSSYGWSVTPNGPVTLSYTATAPSSQGNLNFEAVWFDPSGFNRNQAALSVAPALAAPPIPAPSPAAAAAASPSQSPASRQAIAAKSSQSPGQAPSSSMTWVWLVVILAIIIGAGWYYLSK